MSALATLTNKLASKLELGEGAELIEALKATAFRGQVSDAQMMALMAVANQYGLNPWTREIYAFPDKHNGIVPVVGVDGWSRIINNHPQFDGIEFAQTDSECTCRIYRKDRAHPTTVTEYMAECYRETGPWKSHPKRMLRHKAMIQCARIAMGYIGIFEPDEAEMIARERDMGAAVVVPETTSTADKVKARLGIEAPPEPVEEPPAPEPTGLNYDDLVLKLKACESSEELDTVVDQSRELYPELDQGHKTGITRAINEAVGRLKSG
jgi:phage recombination protein Bet